MRAVLVAIITSLASALRRRRELHLEVLAHLPPTRTIYCGKFVLGIFNAILRPLLILITLSINLLTLGLPWC